MKIKTLAEILAESESDSANLPAAKTKPALKKTAKPATDAHFASSDNKVKPKIPQSSDDSDSFSDYFLSDDITSTTQTDHRKNAQKKAKKRKKNFHPAAHFIPEPNDTPAYQSPKPQSIKDMLAEVKRDISDKNQPHDDDNSHDSSSDTDNLPAALKAYLRTPEQRQADIDEVKAESRLRWLAFYYLSRREYGKAELKQKLIDKEQDPEKIDALLDEFEEKGYQSDYRTTLMLIRESIRKGRGRGHIKQEFYRKKIDMPSNIDELIDMANAESDEFIEFIDDNEDSLVEGVDWLKLAVTARTKKYGDDIPSEQKDKARQLRFLQYRGFDMDICFQALNYTLDNLDERF